MYSPSLQYSLAEIHLEELRRSRGTWSPRPIITGERTATQPRHRVQPSTHVSRAIERLVGHAVPEAPAFDGRP